MRLFSAPELFTPAPLIWYEKPAPKPGARKWSPFTGLGAGFWSTCHGYSRFKIVLF